MDCVMGNIMISATMPHHTTLHVQILPSTSDMKLQQGHTFSYVSSN